LCIVMINGLVFNNLFSPTCCLKGITQTDQNMCELNCCFVTVPYYRILYFFGYAWWILSNLSIR